MSLIYGLFRQRITTFFLLSLKGKILKTHLERIEIIITLEQKAANRDR